MQKDARKPSSLDDVVFHLLHRASQRADDLFVAEVGESDLTPRQFAVLVTVGEIDDPSQTDLTDATGIDRSTLADLVKRLIRKGLLQRRRSRTDARAYIVRLSDAGRAGVKSMQSKAARSDGKLLAQQSEEQRKALVEMLRAISGE